MDWPSQRSQDSRSLSRFSPMKAKDLGIKGLVTSSMSRSRLFAYIANLYIICMHVCLRMPSKPRFCRNDQPQGSDNIAKQGGHPSSSALLTENSCTISQTRAKQNKDNTTNQIETSPLLLALGILWKLPWKRHQ